MKKFLLFLVKLTVSGILALTVLNLFTLVYYNPPKAVAQPDKFTNSRYESEVSWSFMTEGFGSGDTNSLGYNSAEPDLKKPMIAFIGSSHTEALEVNQEDNFVTQTQNQLYGDSLPYNDIQCQNFGMAGHFFNISVSNFEYFANAFDNVHSVVIETHELDYSPEQLGKMLNGEYHKELGARSTLYNLAQKIPYLRLINKQYQDTAGAGEDKSSKEKEFDPIAYHNELDKVMKKLSGIAAEKGFSVTVLYHNWIQTDENNKPYRHDDAQQREIFREVCAENGIYFIDATDSFIEHYEKTYEFPYGFANTTPGAGHLNNTGHKLISNILYEHITKITEGK